MPRWLGYALALIIVLALAPGMAWLGHKHGAKVKRGAALASLMLGFGVIFDPPRRPPVDAQEEKEKGRPPGGEPPTA